MAISNENQIVLDTMYTGHTSDTVSVTWTATMRQGSMLLANNTEAAVADVATVAKVINDPVEMSKSHNVGDTVLVNVAVRGSVFQTSELKYSDAGTAVPASLALLAQTNIFK